MPEQTGTKLRDSPYLSLLRTAWQYARGRHGRFLFIYSLFTLSNILTSLFPIVWGTFINRLQLEGFDAIRALWLYLGAYLALHFAYWACHFPGRIMERKLAFELSANMLREVYHKIVRLPLAWHRDHHSGNTVSRVQKAYGALKGFFDSGFSYFSTVARMIIALLAIVIFSPLFGVFAVLVGVGIVYMILKFDKPFIAASTETNERDNELTSGLVDSLTNIITVVTLRLGIRMENNIMQRVWNVWPPFQRQTGINERKWFFTSTGIALMYLIIIAGYVYQNYVPGEIFLLGGLVTLSGYVNQFTSVFSNLTGQYTQIVRYHTDVGSIEEILDTYRRGHRPEPPTELPRDWKSMDMRDLHFTYRVQPDGEQQRVGLQGINLHIERGKRIALIGESGSGKSTILALVRGLYKADQLQFLLDGQPIDNLALVYEQTTLIPQEPEIFENTVESNITMGLPFPPEEIAKVLHYSVFDEVLPTLPDGLNTYLAEKGANFSGGQKQRLAIARGLLAGRTSTLLLLDEPTSSVDPKKEVLIYERIFAAYPDKAIISTLHRLHLLRYFDYVYLIKSGRVLEEGTFSDLLENSSAFQEMWRHQQNILA